MAVRRVTGQGPPLHGGTERRGTFGGYNLVDHPVGYGLVELNAGKILVPPNDPAARNVSAKE
nr:hypothetical protein [Ruegeria atlantica]